MFFEREEIRLMIGALIFLFPQFPKVRAWSEGVHLKIWEYYDQLCFKPFTDELRKPENRPLLDWARPLAKRHMALAQNTDYAFSGLFYQLLQFPLFSRFLAEEALQGVDKGRAARNLGTFSKLLTKFEYLHYVNVLNPEYLTKNLRNLFNQFLRFLQDGGIGEYEDEAEYAPKGCVSFLTIHQSKGLEFPIVVCGSLEAVPRKQYSALDVVLEDGGYLSKERFEPLDRIKNFDFWRLYYTAFPAHKTCWCWQRKRSKAGASRRPSTLIACSMNCPAGAMLTFPRLPSRRSSRSTSSASTPLPHTSQCSKTAPSSTASLKSWSLPPCEKTRCSSVL